MVRLTVLEAGKSARSGIVSRLPCRIGREAASGFRLEAPGVWEGHAVLELRYGEGFFLRTRPEAPVVIEGRSTTEARLRNGDVIEIGGARVVFALSETRQYSFGLREALTWVAVGVLCGAQVALVYWVLP